MTEIIGLLERCPCGKSWGLTLGKECMQSSQPVAIQIGDGITVSVSSQNPQVVGRRDLERTQVINKCE